MSDPQRIIAVVRDYDEMIGVLRDRITALDCPNEPLEEFMGLTRGHLGKILGQAENKRVGLFVLWRMFEGLGLVMGIHEHLDLDATIDEMGEKYRKRAHWAHSQGLRKRVAPAIMKAAAQHYGGMGRGIRKTFRISRRAVSAQRRKAANARWSKPKIPEVSGAL